MYYLYTLPALPPAKLPVGQLDQFLTERFETRDELMRYWAKKIGGFEYLNVTGKDIYIKTESFRTPAQNSLYDGFETVRTAVVKPFLVTDEMGRHVDIRGWDMPKPTVTLTWNWGAAETARKSTSTA